MLEFKIVDIPEEHSSRVLSLNKDDLDLENYEFRGGEIDLEFYRTLHFIRVSFTINTEVELVCDRSLEPFLYPVEEDFEVLFKVDVQEETEDEDGAIRRFNFTSNTINIEDEVRDTILLSLPIKKLHPKYFDEDGKPTEFGIRRFGEDDAEQEDDQLADQRWAELKKLKNDN